MNLVIDKMEETAFLKNSNLDDISYIYTAVSYDRKIDAFIQRDPYFFPSIFWKG